MLTQGIVTEDEDEFDDAWFEDSIWKPEPEIVDDPIFSRVANINTPALAGMRPSDFTEFAFRMPRHITRQEGEETIEGEEVEEETEEEFEERISALKASGEDLHFSSFSFKERPYMRRIYDTPARRILLLAARQVEKTTLLGNVSLCYMSLIPSFKMLYVSSSATQAKVFSNDRVKEPIETSLILKKFTTKMLSSNIFEKQFINRSKITLRYAFLNADRCRGIPAYGLCIDEFQDILGSNIPVIEQCTAHSPPSLKRYLYAGTPKSLDNNIEGYWSKHSTQGEWVVPHDCKGGETGRYWNILGEQNIGKKGLVCNNPTCKKPITPVADGSQWAAMQEMKVDKFNRPIGKIKFEGFRIPQLMVPWKKWDEIITDYETYERDKFYNEVLGISYDSGLRPLSRANIVANCRENIRFIDAETKYRKRSFSYPVFAGVDWGCHDDKTRILTEDGWKFFAELTDDDRVAQFHPSSRRMTFVRPLHRTAKPWRGELLHFQTRGRMDVAVTPDHRMLVRGADTNWKIEEARQTAARGGLVKFLGSIDWDGEERSTFTLPAVPTSPGFRGVESRKVAMDAWLELLGYLISEGGTCLVDGRPYCLKMSQRVSANPETAARIQAVLDACNVPHTAFPNSKTSDINWTIYGKQYWLWFSKNVGKYGYLKRVPREFMQLSKRQLQILFDALMAGDGSWDKRENCTGGTYSSTSRGLCEDVQEIAIRLGYRATVRLQAHAEGNRRTKWVTCLSIGRDLHLNTPNRLVKHVPYDGMVYCVTVPDGCIVTERDGCISYHGNSGENTYTVISLGTYVDMKFRIFFCHRFEGEDTSPDPQMKKIIELIEFFNVRIIGSDYGGGFDRNDTLTRKFGPMRLAKFQYMARSKMKVGWNSKFGRYQLSRTEIMSDIFNAIKRGNVFEFPRESEFMDPFGQDMLNIYSEYNEKIRMIQYAHGLEKPDDTFHSILYCFLASFISGRMRPDIIAPRREVNGLPVPFAMGPHWQG